MTVNIAIVNGDYDNIGVTDYKVEERSVSHAEKISAGSIQIPENESMLDATDRSARTGFQMTERKIVIAGQVPAQKNWRALMAMMILVGRLKIMLTICNPEICCRDKTRKEIDIFLRMIADA
jgi:hypothetical protein